VPTANLTRTQLSYQVVGTGEPVVLLPPAATRAEVWQAHQVPALVDAGYQVVTVDGRGMPPSPCPPGPYRIDDLVEDMAALLRQLGTGPYRLVGASLGAMVVQELTMREPQLVRAAALIGTRARTDYFRRMLTRVNAARVRRPGGGQGTELETVLAMTQLFSARTLADERKAADWFALLRNFPLRGEGLAAQYEASLLPDRRAALAAIDRPCLVVGFSEDVITPPAACREVALAIPGCRYIELPHCGHFGFLESPQAVNSALTAFFAAAEPVAAG
jgi:pimeloyl-ACP methyl ester carboxylesterase